MRIALATVRTPFIQGGGELLAEGLLQALQHHGHEADIVSTPFSFDPPGSVRRSMAWWREADLNAAACRADRVICLKFPAYDMPHPHKTLWLLHQHRRCYELWSDTHQTTPEDRALRADIQAEDTRALAAIPRRFTIARTVSDRLRRYNGVSAAALYHPPPWAERFYCLPDEMYIWCPSRLETLKRQSLLIDAMRSVRPPVIALIAGAGGQRDVYAAQIARLGLEGRVRLLGAVDQATMLAGYAMSLAVFFGPHDEDYGYVTLEAMLSGKPVITCTDSGGPTEFVRHGETGLSIPPDLAALAEAINGLAADRSRASAMGRAGQELYARLKISWNHVVEKLLID